MSRRAVACQGPRQGSDHHHNLVERGAAAPPPSAPTCSAVPPRSPNVMPLLARPAAAALRAATGPGSSGEQPKARAAASAASAGQSSFRSEDISCGLTAVGLGAASLPSSRCTTVLAPTGGGRTRALGPPAAAAWSPAGWPLAWPAAVSTCSTANSACCPNIGSATTLPGSRRRPASWRSSNASTMPRTRGLGSAGGVQAQRFRRGLEGARRLGKHRWLRAATDGEYEALTDKGRHGKRPKDHGTQVASCTSSPSPSSDASSACALALSVVRPRIGDFSLPTVLLLELPVPHAGGAAGSAPAALPS